MVERILKKARDVIVVEGTEGRNPFEVFLLAWCAVAGGLLAFGTPQPGSLQALLPQWMVTTWYILLCIGGLVGLVGVWQRKAILSLLVERAAMLVVSPAGLLYSVALFSLGGARAILSGGFVMAFAAAAFVRFVRIQLHLKRIRSLLDTVAKT